MRTDAEDYTAVSEQWLLFGLTATLVSTRIFCKPLRSNFFLPNYIKSEFDEFKLPAV